jgi:hypothetical protein
METAQRERQREREREEQQRKIAMGNVFIQSMSNS